MATSKPRGVYREHMGWANQHNVLVDNGTTQIEISEEKYRKEEPAFDKVPWRPKDGANP